MCNHVILMVPSEKTTWLFSVVLLSAVSVFIMYQQAVRPNIVLYMLHNMLLLRHACISNHVALISILNVSLRVYFDIESNIYMCAHQVERYFKVRSTFGYLIEFCY